MDAVRDRMFDTSALQPPPAGRDWRLPLVILLTILLAYLFWSGSRYPALNEKAMMGGDTPLSGLAFDIAIEIKPTDGIWQILWANTVNWIVTNMKGMSFGVLFGAMALTLLSLLRRRSFKNGFANSALGTVIGAPLGVCVNCAAPIALGLHAGRLRLETTLSAMLASPTLNVIVVTMSFALLPVHVAGAKLLVSLLMVLIGVPLLCRWFLKEETARTHNDAKNLPAGPELTGLSGWLMRNLAPREYVAGEFGPLATIVWFVRNYARNFFYIFIVTVPMMFLAAVLGAVFIEVFSPAELSIILPVRGEIWILVGIIAVAAIASFAPAPIALDVILTTVVIGIGLRDHYGAALVVALGSFSIYAFLIVWRAISLRTALYLWAMVVGAATAAGCLTILLKEPTNQYKIDGYQTLLRESGGIEWPQITTPPPAARIAPAPTVASQPVSFTQAGGAEIQSIILRPFGSAPSPGGGPNFARLNAQSVGIDVEDRITGLSRLLNYGVNGGVAAGDFDNDGWTDLATRQSIFVGGFGLFRNVGGRFERYPVDLGELSEIPVLNLAFVDMDGDEALDLVVATDGAGNHILYNRNARFSIADSVKLPGKDLARTRAFAFADFDRNGTVDIALGNNGMTLRSAGFFGSDVEEARNAFLFNRGGGEFESVRADLFSGQTLALLASDFDRNGTIDLLNGDDVANTDTFALFAKDGSFEHLQGERRLFPYRLQSSMGYDEGDWNNDLIPDYHGVQVAGMDNDASMATRTERLAALCNRMGDDARWDAAERRDCRRRLSSYAALKGAYRSGLQSTCDLSPDPQVRQLCAAQSMFHFYHDRRTRRPDTALYDECMHAVQRLPRLEITCESLLLTMRKQASKKEIEAALGPRLAQANVLFTGQADGSFVDEAEAQGIHRPGWSWDARFMDFDQDGWQDIYVLTGWWGRAPDAQTNRFYRNDRGRFEDRTEAFGLTDLVPSFSGAFLDFDRDGDIDLVRALSGPSAVVHRNDRPAGKALWVYLRQPGGNSMAIGARVTVCTDGETQVRPGKCQTRPIKASGGFAAFDPIAAHFGLGSAREVSLIEIIWPDGERSLVRPAGLGSGEIVIRR